MFSFYIHDTKHYHKGGRLLNSKDIEEPYCAQGKEGRHILCRLLPSILQPTQRQARVQPTSVEWGQR